MEKQYIKRLFLASVLTLSAVVFTPATTYASEGETNNEVETETEVETEVEIDDDGIDNDHDGKTDEVNTGVHPGHESDDVDDDQQFEDSVSTFEGAAKGKLKIKFKDGSRFEHRIFNNATAEKDTVVAQVKGAGALLAVRGNGRTIAAVNPYTGKKLDTEKLALARTFGTHSLKQYDFLKDGSTEAVVISRNNKNVTHITVLRFSEKTNTLKVVSRKTVLDTAASPKRTTFSKDTITLKNSKGKTLKTIVVNSDSTLR